MAKKTTSSSTRKVRRSRTPSLKNSKKTRGSSQKKSNSRGFSLSRDRKLDLLGLLMIAVSVFTLVSMIAGRENGVGSAWIRLLKQGFGWGMIVVPLMVLAAGLWLVLRTFGDKLPNIKAEQIIGVSLLYLAILVAAHGVLGVRTFQEGVELAKLGRGGGMVGATLLAALLKGLGGSGAFIFVLAWFFIGVLFTFGITLQEVLRAATSFFDWGWEQLAGGRKNAGQVVERSALKSATAEQADAPSAPFSSRRETKDPVDKVELQAAPSMPWELPRIADLLEPGLEGRVDDTYDRERARLIEETLQAFGAPAHVVEINRGPTITQFGVEPDFLESRSGRRTKVKVSKISALADDLALALAASSIRIEAPVPGKGFVGIEVPNPEITLVALRDVMEADAFTRIRSNLALGLGMDVSGHAVAADLAAMPHLLIAGTTGSGKSVCVNTIIASLLLQNTPDNLRFVMVDPKRVELTYYNGIPHLLAPVVVELERVVPMLQWVLREMDQRYQRFAKEGVRNIRDFNQRMSQTEQDLLHYIVVIIDELADLMMMAPDETERVITRLAQLARATGIHLVIATQRPSVDVVTGLIKANFPARIAFAVASSVDSRVIIDQPGAERLLGRGDMLLQSPDAPAPLRMQGAYMSESELMAIIRFWKNASLGGEITQPSTPVQDQELAQRKPLEQAPLWEELAAEADGDPLFEQAVAIVREKRRASISMLQRRMRIGYTRAARLIDQMEERGIIGASPGGSKPREILDYGEITPES